MSRGTNRGARGSLGLNEEDENEEQCDCGADKDSSCNLSVCHLGCVFEGRGKGERGVGWECQLR